VTTIIIISPPPPPPPPPNQNKLADVAGIDVQADGVHTFQPFAAEENCAPTRVSSYNAALRALNDAFEAGCAIRVVDA
jgi:hypothetical protein